MVSAAIESLRELLPEARVQRDGFALRIFVRQRIIVWNLGDAARVAQRGPNWRAEIAAQARQVVAEPDPRPINRDRLEARMCNVAQLPAELRTHEWAVEPILGELWAAYGYASPNGLAVQKWHDLPAEWDRPQLRSTVATNTLGDELDLVPVSGDGPDAVPVYTNRVQHPHTAAALLMPREFWSEMLEAYGTRSLLLAAPSAGRLFVTPHDIPEMIVVLQQLSWAAIDEASDFLSESLFRFRDGQGWSVVSIGAA